MRVIPQGKTSRYVAEIWAGDAPLRELWMGDKKLWPDDYQRVKKLVVEGLMQDAWVKHALIHGTLSVRLGSTGKEYTVSRIARENDVCTSLKDGMSLYFAEGDGPLLDDVLRVSKVYFKAASAEYWGENYANYREDTERGVDIDLPHLPGSVLYTQIGKCRKKSSAAFLCRIQSRPSGTEVCHVSNQYNGHGRGERYNHWELNHDVVPGDDKCRMAYATWSAGAANRFQIKYPAFEVERTLHVAGWVPEQKER